MRMSEGDYIETENQYRGLLQQFGFTGDRYRSPEGFVGLFQGDVSPNELQNRLQIWDSLEEADDLRDTFYVYTGQELSKAELYSAVADPSGFQRLHSLYNRRVAGQQLNYQQWITRATQVGLSRVAKALQNMERSGAVTGAAVQRVLQINPDFARRMMDSIFTGGTGTTAPVQSISLNELVKSFEFAAIGAAARNAGLELPTKERLAEIRAAGVDRAKASESYRRYGQFATRYNAAVQRATGREFGQEQFERAEFLGSQRESQLLEAGLGYMEAAGRASGSFRFDQDRSGRLVQRGFRDQAA